MGTQVETADGKVVAKRMFAGQEVGCVVQCFFSEDQWEEHARMMVTPEDEAVPVMFQRWVREQVTGRMQAKVRFDNEAQDVVSILAEELGVNSNELMSGTHPDWDVDAAVIEKLETWG